MYGGRKSKRGYQGLGAGEANGAIVYWMCEVSVGMIRKKKDLEIGGGNGFITL